MAVRETEIGVKMIEIALGVLAGEPDKNEPAKTKALREWAVKILALYSPSKAPLTEQAKSALLDYPLPVATTIFDPGSGRYFRGVTEMIGMPEALRREHAEQARTEGRD
jgi:hypothetical protein